VERPSWARVLIPAQVILALALELAVAVAVALALVLALVLVAGCPVNHRPKKPWLMTGKD
jgi:hypothetical protein